MIKPTLSLILAPICFKAVTLGSAVALIPHLYLPNPHSNETLRVCDCILRQSSPGWESCFD
jgi:hypothetical protein